jgi:hypothetical protein
MRSSAAALYFAHRDWTGQGVSGTAEVRRVVEQLLRNLHSLLSTDRYEPSMLDAIYRDFSGLSQCNERLRSAGVTSSELARAHEYLYSLVNNFERLRNARRYGTPSSLRSYAKIFLNRLPVLFAPNFAYLASQHSAGMGYVMAALYGFILVSLDNISDALEDPFDGLGEDDISLDALEDYQRLASL